jgi:hypothetical protein
MEKHVRGHDGRRLTLDDLPSPGTKRWVIRRKAEVVAAVRGGLLSQEEACSRYNISNEEFQSWQQSIDRYGLAGLRTTHLQFYSTSVARVQTLALRGLSSRVMTYIGVECGKLAEPHCDMTSIGGTSR